MGTRRSSVSCQTAGNSLVPGISNQLFTWANLERCAKCMFGLKWVAETSSHSGLTCSWREADYLSGFCQYGRAEQDSMVLRKLETPLPWSLSPLFPRGE